MMPLFSAALRLHRQQRALLRRNRTLVIILWLAASVTGIAVAFSRTADSDAANLAFDQAKVSPIMIHSLGQPIRLSSFAFGDLEIRGSGGQASVSFSVYGPRGRGTLHADAVRFHRLIKPYPRRTIQCCVNLRAQTASSPCRRQTHEPHTGFSFVGTGFQTSSLAALRSSLAHLRQLTTATGHSSSRSDP